MANLSDLIHGKKPEIAPFIPTDPIEMLRKLLEGEITDWPQIQELGNLFQSDVFDKLSQAGLDLKSLIGLGGEDAQKALQQAGTMLGGELPPDVMAQAFRSSAFQNLGSGLAGSQAGAANQARQLGLTSLDVMRQGADLATSGGNAAQRWQQIAMGTVLPTTSQLYSPDWFTNFMAQQSAAKTANLQLKYNTEAAPDPAWSHRAAMLASLLGSFAGPGGSSMGNAIAQNPNLNFSGGAGGAGMGGMGTGGTVASNNPGFFSNFGTAASGGQQTGVGGWLGHYFSSSPQYMGGMPSDVSNRGYQVYPNTTSPGSPGGIGDTASMFNQYPYYG